MSATDLNYFSDTIRPWSCYARPGPISMMTVRFQCLQDRENGKVKHCYENDKRWR